MVVYIEYVLAENFVLDCALIALSSRCAKAPCKRINLLLSALFGALFALLSPLFSLPIFWDYLLKICAGFFLCFFAFPHLKNKKQRSMYASICLYFFCISFIFAGALFAFLSFSPQGNEAHLIKNAPFSLICSSFVFLCLFCERIVKKLQQKHRTQRYIYPCRVTYNEKSVLFSGFLDSGNKASKNGVPVCFISPAAAYDVGLNTSFFDNETSNTQGQVRDEMLVRTVSGKKTLRLYLGEIAVQNDKSYVKKQVYFSISTHILSHEYDLIFPASILDDIT